MIFNLTEDEFQNIMACVRSFGTQSKSDEPFILYLKLKNMLLSKKNKSGMKAKEVKK